MVPIKKAISNPQAAVDHVQYHSQRKAGRFVFNVNRPFSQVAAGKIAKKKSQVLSKLVNEEENKKIEKLKNDQKIELGQIYKNNLIDSLSESFDKYLEENGPTYTTKFNSETYTQGIDISEINAKKHFPEIEGLINEDISNLLRRYYQSYFKPVSVNIWRNRHIPPEVVAESEVFSNYWHFDGHTTDHIKLFVYLSDVTGDDGPFHHITEPESREIANNSFARKEDGVPNGKVDNMATVQKFTGTKGSAALCNTTKILHRAGVPSEGNTRDLLQIMFAPTTEPLKENWLDNPENYKYSSETYGLTRLLHY